MKIHLSQLIKSTGKYDLTLFSSDRMDRLEVV